MAARKNPDSSPTGAASAAEQLTDPLYVLNAIAAEASRTLDVTALLNLALDQMIALTRMEGGAVLLVDGETQRLTLAAERNFPQAAKELILREPPPVGQAIPGIAAQRCQLLIVNNSKEDDRELPPFRVFGVMTHICIPLAVRGRALGVLGMMRLREELKPGTEPQAEPLVCERGSVA